MQLPENTLYCKWSPCVFGEMEIKASSPKDGWGNDWITDNFLTFLAPPHDVNNYFFEVGDEFRFDDNQTIRDGLYETDEETLYAIFDNEDINQIIKKLKTCLRN